ncbi:hypothetical protein ABZT45_21140 [Streptomyces sp. NPDC005356]
MTTDRYWYHRQRQQPHRVVYDETFRDRLLQTLIEETGTKLSEQSSRTAH